MKVLAREKLEYENDISKILFFFLIYPNKLLAS